MTALSLAIERGQWELASLQLLLGVSRAAQLLPPESLHALIDLLAGEDGDESGGAGPASAPPRRSHLGNQQREARP
jgi:hypothetical protein